LNLADSCSDKDLTKNLLGFPITKVHNLCLGPWERPRAYPEALIWQKLFFELEVKVKAAVKKVTVQIAAQMISGLESAYPLEKSDAKLLWHIFRINTCLISD
jgi:hypothetical protein